MHFCVFALCIDLQKRNVTIQFSLLIVMTVADMLGWFILLLCWLTAVFNVGEYRRKAAPYSISNSDFFRPDNKDAQEIREYDCIVVTLSKQCIAV